MRAKKIQVPDTVATLSGQYIHDGDEQQKSPFGCTLGDQINKSLERRDVRPVQDFHTVRPAPITYLQWRTDKVHQRKITRTIQKNARIYYIPQLRMIDGWVGTPPPARARGVL